MLSENLGFTVALKSNSSPVKSLNKSKKEPSAIRTYEDEEALEDELLETELEETTLLEEGAEEEGSPEETEDTAGASEQPIKVKAVTRSNAFLKVFAIRPLLHSKSPRQRKKSPAKGSIRI